MNNGLLLQVLGATETEIQRGLTAAWTVLDRADADPWQASYEAAKENTEMALERTDEQLGLAEAWHQASAAAVAACCAGWRQVPAGCGLEVDPWQATS